MYDPKPFGLNELREMFLSLSLIHIFSFHHHLRDGDYVVNQVMAAAIEELGLKDLTIAATSLGSAHDPIADYIEEGKVIGIQTSRCV